MTINTTASLISSDKQEAEAALTTSLGKLLAVNNYIIILETILYLLNKSLFELVLFSSLNKLENPRIWIRVLCVFQGAKRNIHFVFYFWKYGKEKIGNAE